MTGRTIWELLTEAVSSLPEPFGRADVLAWFGAHHPQVNQTSVSTHLQYAISNAPAPPPTFGRRRPLVTRVGRGLYVRYQAQPAAGGPLEASVDQSSGRSQPTPEPHPQRPVDAPDQRTQGAYPDTVDVVLVGCGRAKLEHAAPASELYVGRPFGLRRAVATALAKDWFILSAEYGLLAPADWASPYDLRLQDCPPSYQSAWGQWCVARLTTKVGDLRGKTVMVLAPAAYAQAVRAPLLAAGATVLEPLAGLRQGEQLAWLTARTRGVPEIVETSHVLATESRPGATPGAPRDQAIAAALLAFGRDHMAQERTRLGFAHTTGADELLQNDPFAFLLGVIFDEGITAERAWQAPYELRRRLGHLDPWRIRDELKQVQRAVAAPPALHRYVDIMARSVVAAAERVCEVYEGDASRIWAPGLTAAEVDARLREFHRIGPKKAAMTVELLVTHFGVELADLTGTNVAYDVHVRRVFLRTGLVASDSITEVTAAARRLNPERPGLIDLPTWFIGRRWCRPTAPDCASCPLGSSCRRLTHLQIRS